MRLEPENLIWGVAPNILQDCAIQLRDEISFTLHAFCIALGAPVSEAKPVLDQMITDEFISHAGPGKFMGTQKLLQLAAAPISKGISRTEAEQLIQKVIRKAKAINEKPSEFAYEVSCLVVFGSYLTQTTTLGDLDIGVGLTRSRPWTKEDYDKPLSGSNERTYYSLLRLRKPQVISVHRLNEVIHLKTPYEVLLGSVEEFLQKSGLT